MRCGATLLTGWPDAARGDQSSGGKCFLGYVIELMSSSLSGPWALPQSKSKFTRKVVKSSPGGVVYAFSEAIDHMTLSRAKCAPFGYLSPGMISFENCASVSTHRRNKKTSTARYLVCHCLRIQRALVNGELGSGYWPPGVEKPANGPLGAKSDTAPLRRMLQSGSLCPGAIRPLREAPFQENGSGRFILRWLLQTTCCFFLPARAHFSVNPSNFAAGKRRVLLLVSPLPVPLCLHVFRHLPIGSTSRRAYPIQCPGKCSEGRCPRHGWPATQVLPRAPPLVGLDDSAVSNHSF